MRLRDYPSERNRRTRILAPHADGTKHVEWRSVFAKKPMSRLVPIIVAAIVTLPAFAQSPNEVVKAYIQQAESEHPGFIPSVERGEILYRSTFAARGSKATSCMTCHTENPKAEGKTLAFKPISALAPVANPERLLDMDKVEKWMRRGCKDVLDRECSVQEKADVLSYLLSVR